MKISAAALLCLLPPAAAFTPSRLVGKGWTTATFLQPDSFNGLVTVPVVQAPAYREGGTDYFPANAPEPKAAAPTFIEEAPVAIAEEPVVVEEPVVLEPQYTTPLTRAPMPVETALIEETFAVEEPTIISTGITADDVTTQDAQAVQLATERLQRLHSNMHPDLMGLIFWIQNGEPTEATVALKELSKVLDQEKAGDETTLAIYRACGHVDIAHAMMGNSDDEELRAVAMQLIWKLSARHRANVIDFHEVDTFQKSLISVGVADYALAALVEFPDDVVMATYSLSVLNNLIGSYSFEELFDLGVISQTMLAMKKYSDLPAIQFAACDILDRAAQDQAAAISKLESIQAISALASVMEQYGGKDERVHSKAEQALQSMLLIGKN